MTVLFVLVRLSQASTLSPKPIAGSAVRAVLPSALMRAFRASAGSGCAFAEDIGVFGF
jgi:hypothetical protein